MLMILNSSLTKLHHMNMSSPRVIADYKLFKSKAAD